MTKYHHLTLLKPAFWQGRHYSIAFITLRMYCIDTEALAFMFNGGSSYGFTVLYYLLSGTLGVSMQYILKTGSPVSMILDRVEQVLRK